MSWIASLAVKWLVTEEFSGQASLLLDRADARSAPELLFAEATNALWAMCCRGDIARADFAEAWTRSRRRRWPCAPGCASSPLPPPASPATWITDVKTACTDTGLSQESLAQALGFSAGAHGGDGARQSTRTRQGSSRSNLGKHGVKPRPTRDF